MLSETSESELRTSEAPSPDGTGLAFIGSPDAVGEKLGEEGFGEELSNSSVKAKRVAHNQLHASMALKSGERSLL